MFGMKTKKRVKKLEENQEIILRNQYELEKSIDSVQENIKDLAAAFRSKGTSDINSDLDKIKGEFKGYVDTQINECKRLSVSVNDVSKMIDSSEKKLVDHVASECKRVSVQKISPQEAAAPVIDYELISRQISEAVQQAYNSDQRVIQLNNLLYNEIERSKQLENTIYQLQQRIGELERKNMSGGYVPQSAPVSVPVSEPAPVPVSVPVKKPEPKMQEKPKIIVPLFTDEQVTNERKLDNILKNAQKLKENYSRVLFDSEENSVYFKTIDNCIKKLQKLSDKAAANDMEPSKIVSELVKLFNSTIIKNCVNKNLNMLVDEFMQQCKFVKKELTAGTVLTDEDYNYIGEMPLDVPVSSPEKHNTIIEKEHDAYIIYYKDEEGLSSGIIEGKCSIGKYVK